MSLNEPTVIYTLSSCTDTSTLPCSGLFIEILLMLNVDLDLEYRLCLDKPRVKFLIHINCYLIDKNYPIF